MLKRVNRGEWGSEDDLSDGGRLDGQFSTQSFVEGGEGLPYRRGWNLKK